MDFAALVLMRKDKDNILSEELGSYKVGEGAKLVSKMYCIDNEVSVFFSTERDVEEWEFSAIYDNFNEELFEENNFKISFEEDEYNPTWKVNFEFIDEFSEMEEKVSKLCELIDSEMKRVFEEIKDKEEEYKED